MYTSLGHGGKHVDVTSLKMLWQNQGTFLFSFTALAMLSRHLLEPFQEEGHVIQELHKKFYIYNNYECVCNPNKASLIPQPSMKCCVSRPAESVRLRAYFAYIHTVL